MYKKHFTAIGDSHTNIATVWRKLAEYTGSTYHHVTTETVDGTTFYTVDGIRTGVSRLMPLDPTNTLWENEVALALISSGVPIDYIFYQNTHLGNLGVWEVDDDVKPIMIESHIGIVDTIFNSRQAALNYVATDIASIISELEINSAQAGFIITYNTATQLLKFAFSDGTTFLNKDTEFSLYFGSDITHKLTVNLKAGSTLEECVFAMNDYAFNEYSDWTNSNKGVHGYESISLIYNGTQISNYPIAQIEVTEGSNLAFAETPSIMVNTTGIPYLYYGENTKGLKNASNWKTYGGVASWVKPNIMMGSIEYIKDHFPYAKFVGIGVPAYRSQNVIVEFNEDGSIANDGALNSDGSINLWAILNSTTQLNNKKSTECIKNLCDYYDSEFLDIFHYGEITPRNAYLDESGNRTPYYEWYNSHCTLEGYAAWARSIMYLLKGK